MITYNKRTKEYAASCKEHRWSVAGKTEKEVQSALSFHEKNRHKEQEEG